MEALYGARGALTLLARQAGNGAGEDRRGYPAEVGRADGGRVGVYERAEAAVQPVVQSAPRRFGTLWAERFKSVVVEDQPSSVEAVAAYIDLNPVRAGLVEDPKDYRFCGYAAAVAGNTLVRNGLMSFQKKSNWSECAAAYRVRLFVGAGAAHQSGKVILDREKIKEVLEQGGELSLGQVLRLRGAAA